MSIFLNTPYEALIGFSIIVAIIACTLKSYCRQKNINGYFVYFSDLLFWISCASIVITVIVAFIVSYKRKGEYYERIKSKKSILIFCGIGIVVCIILFIILEFFDRT